MLISREYSLLLLLMSGATYRISALANYYGVTARVIYYNAENIDKYLEELAKDKYSPGPMSLQCADGCLKLGGHFPDNRNMLIGRILDDARYEIALSQEERQLELLYRVLTGKSIRIPDLTEEFAVSKSTVLKDLELLREYFSQRSVQLKHTAGQTIPQSDEFSVRLVAAGYMAHLLNVNHGFYRMVQETHIWQFRPYCFYLHCMGDLSFGRLAELIEESASDIDLPYRLLCNCLCGIMISMIREQSGHHLTVSRSRMEFMANLASFDAARRLVEKINFYVPVSTPGNLAAFVALIAAGAEESTGFKVYLASRIDFKILAANITAEICRLAGLTPNQKLIEEVQSEICRICIGGRGCVEHENHDLANMIQNDYEHLWNAVEQGAKPLCKLMNHPLSGQQIGRLALHFVDACEEIKGAVPAPQVLIVCNSGLVSSRLICRKLQSLFQIKMLGCVSIYEMNHFLKNHSVDYIITTVPVLQSDTAVIQVNSYLSGEDLGRLRRILPPRSVQDQLVEQILEAARESGAVTDPEGFAGRLETILGLPAKERSFFHAPGISGIIDTRNILLDFPCSGLEEAVRKSGLLLLQAGAIDPVYVEEIVENIRHAPEYMLIGDGILMPHSRAAEHVFQTAVSVIRLKTPVSFNDSGPGGIRWIFTLAAEGRTGHLTALEQLSQILAESWMMSELEQVCLPSQFKELLDKFVAINNQKERGGDVVD